MASIHFCGGLCRVRRVSLADCADRFKQTSIEFLTAVCEPDG